MEAATMTEPRAIERRPACKPSGAVVFWASAALFAVLFALLTFQLSSTTTGTTAAAPPVQVRKVVKRRIVTTVVPSPGVTQVSSGPATASTAAVPTEPIATSTS
jgi:hypothetical protein